MLLSRKRKAIIFLIAMASWLAVTFNFLFINRYVYKATELINYAGGFAAIVCFYLMVKVQIKTIRISKSKDFIDFIVLLILPPAMAVVAFFTFYAIGSTATQIISLTKKDENLFVTITDKNVKDYVPPGGCRYTINLYLNDKGVKINNHCVDGRLFSYLNIGKVYSSRGVESVFGIVIYEINKKSAKTVPSLRKF